VCFPHDHIKELRTIVTCTTHVCSPHVLRPILTPIPITTPTHVQLHVFGALTGRRLSMASTNAGCGNVGKFFPHTSVQFMHAGCGPGRGESLWQLNVAGASPLRIESIHDIPLLRDLGDEVYGSVSRKC